MARAPARRVVAQADFDRANDLIDKIVARLGLDPEAIGYRANNAGRVEIVIDMEHLEALVAGFVPNE